jgi:hypothetical protein
MVDVERAPAGWFAKLRLEGMQVAEYTRDAPIGVARPEKYW